MQRRKVCKKQQKKKSNKGVKQDKYVIRKFVMATSVEDAIRKDRKTPVQGCWIDDSWFNENIKRECSAIGFQIPDDAG